MRPSPIREKNRLSLQEVKIKFGSELMQKESCLKGFDIRISNLK
jgi:hypothetical protein